MRYLKSKNNSQNLWFVYNSCEENSKLVSKLQKENSKLVSKLQKGL